MPKTRRKPRGQKKATEPQTVVQQVQPTQAKPGTPEAPRKPPEKVLTADPTKEPMEWLWQFAEALADIANNLMEIRVFDSAQERRIAAHHEKSEPFKSEDSFIRVWRARYGKESADKFVETSKKLSSRTADEYVQSVYNDIIGLWPFKIDQTKNLLREAYLQRHGVFGESPLREVGSTINAALGLLWGVVERGESMIDEWEATRQLSGLTDQDRIGEIFSRADGLAQYIRGSRVQRKLEQLAADLSAYYTFHRDLTQNTTEQKLTSPLPLCKGAVPIYEHLRLLESHLAMTFPEIQKWYENRDPNNWTPLDEGTWKRWRVELEMYGMENRPNVGYYIPKIKE